MKTIEKKSVLAQIKHNAIRGQIQLINTVFVFVYTFIIMKRTSSTSPVRTSLSLYVLMMFIWSLEVNRMGRSKAIGPWVRVGAVFIAQHSQEALCQHWHVHTNTQRRCKQRLCKMMFSVWTVE